MKIIKKHLCDLPSCYATAQIYQDGRTKFLIAPDAYGPCYSIDSDTLERETVWQSPGGTMAMVPLPGKNGDFLAVQRFFPDFQAQDAEIVHVFQKKGRWQQNKLFKLPYVHRFDILTRSGINYIICCTLCTTKKHLDDWNAPGKIYAAELPDDLSHPILLKIIADGMNRNHGYLSFKKEDYDMAMTACDQGVFNIEPPEQRNGKWIVRKVLDKPVSDIALVDINGDGIAEMFAIEPFHGTDFTIYQMTKEGYTPIYRYPEKLEFCHAIWGGKVRNETVFIGGSREGRRELFMLRYKNGSIKHEIIEAGSGPANVTVVNGRTQDLIVATNRDKGEVAMYVVRDN
jgi:hypothetical protein